MPFKKIYPTGEQKKKLRILYKANHTYHEIADELKIGYYLVQKWIKILNIRKIDVCSWCGRSGYGKRVGKRWLCKTCDSHRCQKCGILLSQTRKDKQGMQYGSSYKKHPEYCKACWKIISEEKQVQISAKKLSTDLSIDKK